MSRDLVLATLAFVLGGAGVWLTSWVPGLLEASEDARVGGRRLERRCWRRLWLPALPAATALATLFGWALQEPSVTDERLLPFVALVVVPLGLLWLRCAWRAAAALRAPRPMPMVATLGLLRPRVVVAEDLERVLDPRAFAAALAHERAHVRHFDPLRVWLAQIATDIQWPNPTARLRLERWLASLELARDEEARLEGAPGEDLAAAVVAVAKLARLEPCGAVVGLTGAEASLVSRIHRLLGPVPSDHRVGSFIVPVAVIVALAAGIAAGVLHGDSFLRALPFITT